MLCTIRGPFSFPKMGIIPLSEDSNHRDQPWRQTSSFLLHKLEMPRELRRQASSRTSPNNRHCHQSEDEVLGSIPLPPIGLNRNHTTPHLEVTCPLPVRSFLRLRVFQPTLMTWSNKRSQDQEFLTALRGVQRHHGCQRSRIHSLRNRRRHLVQPISHQRSVKFHSHRRSRNSPRPGPPSIRTAMVCHP